MRVKADWNVCPSTALIKPSSNSPSLRVAAGPLAKWISAVAVFECAFRISSPDKKQSLLSSIQQETHRECENVGWKLQTRRLRTPITHSNTKLVIPRAHRRAYVWESGFLVLPMAFRLPLNTALVSVHPRCPWSFLWYFSREVRDTAVFSKSGP